MLCPRATATEPQATLMRVTVLQALKVGVLSAGSRPLARRLREIHTTLQNGALPHALKLIDRAWRHEPEAAGMLAPLYGRLLLLEERDPDAALRVLSRVETPDADVAALRARAYFRLRRADDARRCLDAALKAYCVDPQGLLSHEASATLQNASLQAGGWIGLGPTLEFVGELPHGHAGDSLKIQVGETVLAVSVHLVTTRDGRVLFSFPAPPAAGGRLTASSGGLPLLGSGHWLPLEFALDGRIEGDARGLFGWARVGWRPTEPVQLRVEDENGTVILLKSRSVPLPEYHWPFRVELRGRGLRGDRINVFARLPDKRWDPLPDAPFLLPRAIRNHINRITRLPRGCTGKPPLKLESQALIPCAAPIDIVVPVYRGLHETLACIHSVLSTAGEHAHVVVVDDATVDATLAAALDDLSATGRIILLRNESNLGFVRSVNRVLAMNSGQDIVLLNSDTLVFDDWLRRLRAAAYSEPRVGTVTPFSNDGSIASYPRRFGGAIDPDEAAALDKLAARTHAGISAAIPVGVGFCLYVRHDCLQEVGELDSALFGVGYGEESDFCLRALARGWSHRIAADVFVYHAGGGSFGPRRAALLNRSQRLLKLCHPGYERYVTGFLRQDRLLPLRRKLDERRLAAFEGRFVLLATPAVEGGVERFVTERKQKIRAEGSFALVLKPLRFGDERGCELSTDAIDAPNLRYAVPADFVELTALLRQLRLESVEIQHFLDHDPAVIDAVRALGVPYDVMLHDYAWICPRVTLIDGSGRYCGEPEVSVCQSCVRKHGSRLPRSLSVQALRARSEVWLKHARSVAAPSLDTAARFQKYFRDLDISVSPHTTPSSVPPQTPTARPRSPKRLRVGLIGAIGVHKGYRVLLECARDAAKRRLPLEFIVIGYTENDRPLLRTGRVEVTGRYVDAEVSHLLRREQADLMFLPSVWPETWCYALDHVLAAGLPAVAFDIGAIAERLRAAGDHTLLPLDLDAAQLNDRLLEVGTSRNLTLYVETSRLNSAAAPKIAKTSAKTLEITAMNHTTHELQHDEGLSASLQVLPLLPGLYLFSVKSAIPAGERGRGSLRLPAMHVGLGPGVRSEHVEFVAGPSTEGAWLFARGDVLVAKVNGSGATLILTSVRAANGEVLSIEVERLESRSQAPQLPTTTDKPASLLAPLPPAAESRPAAVIANPAPSSAADGTVPLQIKTHVRSRGDMSFADAAWAGRVAPGLWLECFSIQPLKNLNARDVEYKGLTGTGFETPWLSDDQNCGTKGMSVPLVGFAVRLRPGAATALYDCEYSGYFQSGTVVGPLRNGAPCRSPVANDPLEGLQIRLMRRPKATSVVATKARASAKPMKRETDPARSASR